MAAQAPTNTNPPKRTFGDDHKREETRHAKNDKTNDRYSERKQQPAVYLEG
jgi:hypothetical protein